MAFADVLKRLQGIADEERQRGIPFGQRVVNVNDLRELLQQFYRSDEVLRQQHNAMSNAPKCPRPANGNPNDTVAACLARAECGCGIAPCGETMMGGASVPAVLLPIFEELKRATLKFPTWPTDPLHAFAIVGEEVGELDKAVLQTVYEPHKSSPDDVRTEAIQAAAMALRFVMSLDAYRYERGEQHQQESLWG